MLPALDETAIAFPDADPSTGDRHPTDFEWLVPLKYKQEARASVSGRKALTRLRFVLVVSAKVAPSNQSLRRNGGVEMTASQTIRAPQRWEYCVVSRSTENYLVHDLNERGQEGWELATASSGKDRKGEIRWIAFLKRPCGKHDVPSVDSALNEQIRIEPQKK